MAFVFDDQAVLDRWAGLSKSGRPINPVHNLQARWRDARYLTHLAELISLRLFGVRPAAWHASNIAIHAANAALTGYLFGLLPGLLFFAHPIAGGLCVYVSIRADLLMTFCALLSTAFFQRGGICMIPALLMLWCARSAKACGVLGTVLLWLTALFLSSRI